MQFTGTWKCLEQNEQNRHTEAYLEIVNPFMHPQSRWQVTSKDLLLLHSVSAMSWFLPSTNKTTIVYPLQPLNGNALYFKLGSILHGRQLQIVWKQLSVEQVFKETL